MRPYATKLRRATAEEPHPLGAWLVVTDEGTRLRVADDAAGTKLWPTAEEEQRTAREAVERELAAARAELARLRGKAK